MKTCVNQNSQTKKDAVFSPPGKPPSALVPRLPCGRLATCGVGHPLLIPWGGHPLTPYGARGYLLTEPTAYIIYSVGQSDTKRCRPRGGERTWRAQEKASRTIEAMQRGALIMACCWATKAMQRGALIMVCVAGTQNATKKNGGRPSRRTPRPWTLSSTWKKRAGGNWKEH